MRKSYNALVCRKMEDDYLGIDSFRVKFIGHNITSPHLFFEIYYRTSFQDIVLTGSSASPTTEIRVMAM